MNSEENHIEYLEELDYHSLVNNCAYISIIKQCYGKGTIQTYEVEIKFRKILCY